MERGVGEEMTPRLLQLVLLLQLLILSITAEACQSNCGDVEIPYPFGIGRDCSLNENFVIDCDNNKKPILSRVDDDLEVLGISVEDHTMRVNHPVFRIYGNQRNDFETVNLERTPFFFSSKENMFTGLGCRNYVYMWLQDPDNPEGAYLSGCYSVCVQREKYTTRRDGHNNCTGIYCCQTGIIPYFQSFKITIKESDYVFNGKGKHADHEKLGWRYAFIVEQNWFYDHQDEVPKRTHVPVVLDWGVDNSSSIVSAINDIKNYSYPNADCQNSEFYDNTAVCRCSEGYEGNPYVENGCTDINECETNPAICPSTMMCENTKGNYTCYSPQKSKVKTVMIGVGTSVASLFLFIAVWWLSVIIMRRKDIKRKKEFYKRNGGLLLEQQLHSSDDRVKCKVFCSKDLDKATDHFNRDRVLGEGGRGTVYKGMLPDGRIVAVKMSKVVDELQLKEFINEVFILSQINHRNVVKLLGCCLETEVPLLVYEFVPNGTLFHYLHNQNEDLQFTWDMRLRIVTEVAEALSYLHSAASQPIYHRDIKSANILLDEMLRAKVADFGTSKSISVDQTHATTRVIGTPGYLDPEYYQLGHFTDKSDVYSFGVVLVEVLTGDIPLKSEQVGSSSLSNFINVSKKENHFSDILDAQVQSGKKEEVMKVVSLAQSCLNRDGRERPTMKEVAAMLERIRASQKGSKVEQKHAEIECARVDIIESYDIVYPSTSSTFVTDGPSTDDQPLMTS